MADSDAIGRPVGRPAGQPKSGGRKPGVPNKVTRNVRETILKRGKPLELLCDVARGKKIRVGPQAGPGAPEWHYPTFPERVSAARDLLPYIAPKMQQLSGPDDAHLIPREEPTDTRQLARAILAVLHTARTEDDAASPAANGHDHTAEATEHFRRSFASAQRNAVMGEHGAGGANVVPNDTGTPPLDMIGAEPEGEPVPVGEHGATVRLIRAEMSGRPKWAAFDAGGNMIATAPNREAAEALAVAGDGKDDA